MRAGVARVATVNPGWVDRRTWLLVGSVVQVPDRLMYALIVAPVTVTFIHPSGRFGGPS